MRILVSGSTRTVHRLASGWPDHLGVLLTPANGNSVGSILATHLPWAADNGAFRDFDALAFRRMLRRVSGRPGLLWVACPDIVGDSRATLRLFDDWEPELRSYGVPIALVGQDGMERLDCPWGRIDCLFLGGSTAWKLSRAAADLALEARTRGKMVHMGRVNSLRRLRYAYDFGCHSVDGGAVSRFGETYLPLFLATLQGLEFRPPLFA